MRDGSAHGDAGGGEADDGEEWLREVFELHGPELYRLCRRLLGDPGAAEDLLQEVLVKAWRARARFDADVASRRTWLFAIARNAAADALRARSVRPSLAPAGADTRVVDVAAPDQLDRLADVAVLRDALRVLPSGTRDAVVLTQGLGLTHEEVGRRLGVPPGTVKSRVHGGLRRLRVELREPVASPRRRREEDR